MLRPFTNKYDVTINPNLKVNIEKAATFTIIKYNSVEITIIEMDWKITLLIIIRRRVRLTTKLVII